MPDRPSQARWAGVPALVLVWFALVAPDRPEPLTPLLFLRVPLEGLAVVGLLLLLPRSARRPLSVVAGVALAFLTLLRLLDAGFEVALHRSFDPSTDTTYAGPAAGLLADSVGRPLAAVVIVLGAVAVLAALVAVAGSVVLLGRFVTEHRTGTARAVAALSAVWLGCAVLGVSTVGKEQVASTSTAELAAAHGGQLRNDLRDEAAFSAALAHDPAPVTDVGTSGLLAGLRGKDVLVVFVESYGRVALEDPAIAPEVTSVLDAGTAGLRIAGFTARSAYLTSPTFGGLSWLAHSTLQAGLRIDTQGRYDRLVTSDLPTLGAMFHRAGWRTVCDVPANHEDWRPARTFYRCDATYDARTIAYAGPPFGYAPVPDQYTLADLARRELTPPRHHRVMAEVDLVSSHAPWAPLPRLVGWDLLGDGSVFDGMPEQGQSRQDVWSDPSRVKAAYARSVAYSLASLVSFVESAHDDNLVLVVLGDHQPSSPVTGGAASHDVPVTVVAHDPAVLGRIGQWGWVDGLRPGPGAPVWPMESFRQRFLDAFDGAPALAAARPASAAGTPVGAGR